MSDSTPHKEVILNIRNVGVSYADKCAIQNIDLDVHKGEFFGLIGINGAGKTTLIKTILGLRDPDEGEIYIAGKRVTQNTTSRKIAFLPERFEPSWFLSGIEFLEFSCKLYNLKWSKDEYRGYAERLALDPDALKRRVQTYSKGMRQKLGLLATVMTGAEMLILDEPMSGLDPVARTLVKDLLVDVRKQGRTVFLSSHILADMDEICDRISLMHKNELRFVGTPAELKKQTGAQNLERAFLQYIETKAAA
ncbi:MAG: ABC transporter ATP-binding protein [Micavibrio sp.]|nr:ABC transporter ATP-binding protein [Micavibrio sp.]